MMKFYDMPWSNTLGGAGGSDLATTARIRNGWMKFQELLLFLTSRAPPLERKVECMPVVLEAA